MKKIVKSSLTDQIFDYIQEEILKGTWKSGEKLPSENELAATLGVSRMSLRSAIQRSCAMGFTETRVGEGTFVRDFSLRTYFGELYRMKLLGRNPNEINDLRSVLEIGSIRLAMAQSIPPEEISVLDDLYDQMVKTAENNDLEAFHEVDVQFHHAICDLCKNELLYMIYDAVESLLADITRQNVEHSVQSASGFGIVLEHHRELLESIHSGDTERFVRAIMQSRERSLRYYSSMQDGQAPS